MFGRPFIAKQISIQHQNNNCLQLSGRLHHLLLLSYYCGYLTALRYKRGATLCIGDIICCQTRIIKRETSKSSSVLHYSLFSSVFVVVIVTRIQYKKQGQPTSYLSAGHSSFYSFHIGGGRVLERELQRRKEFFILPS